MNSRIFKSLNLKSLNLILPYALACGKSFINTKSINKIYQPLIIPRAEAAFLQLRIKNLKKELKELRS